jgi:CubicO group peptidase (beta-lactamase class C family)
VGALDDLAQWPTAGAAAAVTDVRDTVADAGEIDAPRPWASVTKLVTAIAVLMLVEAGDVDLDEPAGPPGSTVRHLLAHASGLPFDGTAVVSPPGRRRIYSNTGFDQLGPLVETRSARPFADLVDDEIFGALAMTASTIAGAPSQGGIGSVRDLMQLSRELLAPTLLRPETVALATSVAFPGLDGILPGFGRCTPNDWGLGFELRDHKDPHWTGHTNSPATFGHFGRSGSFLWVDPALSLACVVLSAEPFGPWAAQAWPVLSDAVVAEFGLPRQPTRPVM